MFKTIISDTSCLIVLSKIGQLDLLNKIFGHIITTPEIVEEFGETFYKMTRDGLKDYGLEPLVPDKG